MSKKVTFEEAFMELEKIVNSMESDSSDLNKMLGLFEKGIKLSAQCHKELNDIQNRVVTVIEKNNKFIEKNGLDIK